MNRLVVLTHLMALLLVPLAALHAADASAKKPNNFTGTLTPPGPPSRLQRAGHFTGAEILPGEAQ